MVNTGIYLKKTTREREREREIELKMNVALAMYTYVKYVSFVQKRKEKQKAV